MVIRRTDYTAEAVAAARSVLLEVVHILGEYRDDIVIVGGWVPELLLSGDKALHVGSIDVDLALNHHTLQEPGYKTILMLLRSRGYETAGFIGNTLYLEQGWGIAQGFASYDDYSSSLGNNLAQTLSDQARYQEALEAAQRAVSLGGPLAETAQQTLADIERAMKK